MKKITLLFIVLLCSTYVFAQFKLSGKIKNYTGKEQLQINIPLVYGFYKENSVNVPIAKNGTFAITLPVKEQKFSNLIFKKEFHSLLLSPNKNLVIELDEQNKNLETTSGTALTENKVLTSVNLEEFPFFMEDTKSIENLTREALYKQVVVPYLAMRDKKIDQINRSSITLQDKRRITSEVKYMAYNYLNDLKWLRLKNKPAIDSLIITLYDKINIKTEHAMPGPQYYAFANSYLGNMELKAFFKIKQEKIKPNQPMPYYKISLDSANILVKKHGNYYMNWYSSALFLPDYTTEKLAYQQIINNYNDKDLQHAEIYAALFSNKFPSSVFNDDIKQKINSLKTLLVKNATNKDIMVFDNYQNVTSIYDVIKGLKGKVVYLDVWGTWCGPCKEELKHGPQLKAAFKDKDVVFVYLDMDADEQDAAWKNFIKLNNLTGIHLRKSRATIAPIWKELLADNPNKEEYYPQYFIFDKDGKLAVSKALRPSNNQDLYKQINTVLNKN